MDIHVPRDWFNLVRLTDTPNDMQKKDLISTINLIDNSCHGFYNTLKNIANINDIDTDIEDFTVAFNFFFT